ncbi:MAG TPA: dephospho-CoA kinase [Firmicutes bacterium]|nr:dephospho-CoA kinase [Bacillota bacterium]
MLTVALTGGIASGKTTVAGMFQSLGVPLIDSDLLAHQAIMPQGEAYQEVVAHFGSEILNDDNDRTINRGRLGAIVFGNSTRLQLLNSIVHPVVIRNIDALLSEYRTQGHKVVLIDIPLLYEAGKTDDFDFAILVYVPADMQKGRLLDRNKELSGAEAEVRLKAQLPIEFKVERADFVIDNSGSREQTRAQVEKVWHILCYTAERIE